VQCTTRLSSASSARRRALASPSRLAISPYPSFVTHSPGCRRLDGKGAKIRRLNLIGPAVVILMSAFAATTGPWWGHHDPDYAAGKTSCPVLAVIAQEIIVTQQQLIAAIGLAVTS
jgi:hypothetical protein